MFSAIDIGIDLGTANILVYTKTKGIIINEPSVVALDAKTRAVLAIGTEAKAMLGKAPDSILVIRPLKDGVIADFQVTEKMLQHFISKVHENSFFPPSPRVLVCVPLSLIHI